MLMPFELMYRLRFTPWELRPVVPAWQRITDGPDALPPGRALDVGCGTGRDACYLAGRGWQVTGVDIAAAAIARARRRAAAWGMQVRWVVGDVGALGATALLAAFAPARRVLLRGMSQREVTGLFGAAWELVEAEEVTGPGVPPAGPLGAVPRSTGSSARTPAESPGRSGAGQGRIGVAVPDAGRIRALLARWQVPDLVHCTARTLPRLTC